VPRDEAYYGDRGTNYTYSWREYKSLLWIPELLSLKSRVEEATPEAAYTNLGLPKLAIARPEFVRGIRRERLQPFKGLL
jgi:hypothetical protein